MTDYRAEPRPSGAWQVVDEDGCDVFPEGILFLDKRAAVAAIREFARRVAHKEAA
jgi:hypothetical protein